MPKSSIHCKNARIFVVAFVFALFFLVNSNVALAAVFPENDNLTSEQISERFRVINSSYEVGERFSDSDAEFVTLYASSINGPQSRGSDYFEMSGSCIDGTRALVYGTIYHNGTVNYTYGANATISIVAGETPKMMVFTVRCTSYGLIGDNGVGITYQGSVSAPAANTRGFTASPARTYSSLFSFYIVECYLDVTTYYDNFFTVVP